MIPSPPPPNTATTTKLTHTSSTFHSLGLPLMEVAQASLLQGNCNHRSVTAGGCFPPFLPCHQSSRMVVELQSPTPLFFSRARQVLPTMTGATHSEGSGGDKLPVS